MRTRPSALLTIALLLVAGAAGAAPAPSGQEVIRHLREATRGIRDYTVDLSIHVDVANVRMPDTKIRLYHKAPDKMKMEPLSGFAVVPKGAVFSGDLLERLTKDASAKVIRQETLSGRPTYRVRVAPKAGVDSRPPAEVWVDRERWVVVRVRQQPPGGEPMVIEINYQHFQNKFWLPSRMVAALSLPPAGVHRGPFGRRVRRAHGGLESAGTQPTPASQNGTGSQKAPEGPRKGTVTTTFSNYRVNTGLSDAIFQRKE